jgi:hypothetical protein
MQKNIKGNGIITQRRYVLDVCRGNHIIAPLEDGALDAQVDGGHNFFCLGMGHDSVLELEGGGEVHMPSVEAFIKQTVLDSVYSRKIHTCFDKKKRTENHLSDSSD